MHTEESSSVSFAYNTLAGLEFLGQKKSFLKPLKMRSVTRLLWMCRRGESYVGWILFLSIGRPLGSISSSLPNMRTYISPFTCVKNTGSEPGCSPFKSRPLYPRACPFVKLTSLLCTVFSLGVTGVMSACVGAIRGPELMYAQCLQEEPSP